MVNTRSINQLLKNLLCVLLGTWLYAGCTSNRPPVISLEGIRVPEKAAVIFFVDGLDKARFETMLAAGELPNLERFFVRGGVRVKSALASFPAITYPNAVSLITGCFPGHHGILGNLWFDRQTLQMPDYIRADTYRTVNEHFSRPTLYEILEDHWTVNVQNHTRRGVDVTFDNEIPTAVDWYTRRFRAVDERVRYGLDDIIALADRRKRWPTVMAFYFPGLDEIGHWYGSDSQKYARALRTVDGSIGRVCESIQASVLYERTYFVLMTDHNHIANPPDRSLDIADWLSRKLNLTVHEGQITPRRYADRERLLKDVDVVLIDSAFRRASLHLRGPTGWSSEATSVQVDRILQSGLLDEPAIALGVYRDGTDRLNILSPHGRAVVERKLDDNRKIYRLSEYTGDMLHYQEVGIPETFLRGQWADSHEWLDLTAEADYPDFVPQIMEMFDSPRAGDIVLFAAEDWTFDGSWKGGHGSCLKQDVVVPIYFSGPDLLAGGSIPCARVVDIMPTLLDFLGEMGRLKAVEPIDGRSVAPQLRGAR